MLVKDNLFSKRNLSRVHVKHDKVNETYETIDKYHAARIELLFDDSISVGKEYTVSFKIDRVYGDKELTIGKYPGSSMWKIIKASDRYCTYTFKPDIGNEKILIYMGVSGQGTVGKYKITEIKIEEGTEATPFIPNIKDIKVEKQPFFIGGGTFEEVYPI